MANDVQFARSVRTENGGDVLILTVTDRAAGVYIRRYLDRAQVESCVLDLVEMEYQSMERKLRD